MNEILDYNNERYVDRPRSAELNAVERLVLQAQREVADNRTIVFAGPRGSGKTWLSLRLSRMEDVNRFPALCHAWRFLIALSSETPDICRERHEVCLSVNETEGHYSEDHFISLVNNRLIKQLADVLEATYATNASPGQLTHWLLSRIDKEPDRVLVLIVDSAFETNRSFLSVLEKHLLAPLISHPRVVVVITGRGERHDWEHPGLRTQIDHSSKPLQPFGDLDVHALIERQVREALVYADDICKASGGNPLIARLLAEHLANGASMNDALFAVRPHLYRNVPFDEQANVMLICETLCPIDTFRLEEMQELLMAGRLLENMITTAAKKELRVVRDRLRGYGLLEPVGNGDLQLDRTVREFSRYLLKVTASATWDALACCAWRMYVNWSTNSYASDEEKEYYRDRAAKLHSQLIHPQSCLPEIEQVKHG